MLDWECGETGVTMGNDNRNSMSGWRSEGNAGVPAAPAAQMHWRRRGWGERWVRWCEVIGQGCRALERALQAAPWWLAWQAGRHMWWERRLRRSADPAQLGRAGEALAAAWLRAGGWQLVARNWRHGRGEIDLIGLEGGVLVFVEVKTRSERSLRSGLSAVNRAKRRQLYRAVQAFLVRHSGLPRKWRGEIVEITLDGAGGVRVLRFHGRPWSR